MPDAHDDPSRAHTDARPSGRPGDPADPAGTPLTDHPGAASAQRQPELVTDATTPAHGKPDDVKRAVALLIDAVPAVLVGMVPMVGGLAATVYWLVRDGLDVEFMPNRSLGKKLTGLKPVRLDGAPMDLETSIRRNWPFAVGGVVQILAFIPIIGWLLMIPVALVALGLGLTEAYLAITDDEGRRLGDRTGATRVVDVGDGTVL